MNTSICQENKFYDYIYLDPRKRGQYCYEGLNFSLLYEPFYVGKGCSDRKYYHITPSQLIKQNKKTSIINEILNDNQDKNKMIFQINKNISNNQSLKIERNIIKCIGLTVDGGLLVNCVGGGTSGNTHRHSDEHRKAISIGHFGIKQTTESKIKIGLDSKRRNQGIHHPRARTFKIINHVSNSTLIIKTVKEVQKFFSCVEYNFRQFEKRFINKGIITYNTINGICNTINTHTYSKRKNLANLISYEIIEIIKFP